MEKIKYTYSEYGVRNTEIIEGTVEDVVRRALWEISYNTAMPMFIFIEGCGEVWNNCSDDSISLLEGLAGISILDI